MYKNDRVTRRYSEPFKLKILAELTTGKYNKYQLGKLYVYKLQIELFQYASEFIDTGIPAVDAFESLKSFTTNTTRSSRGEVVSITMTNLGSGYTSVPTVSFVSGSGSGATATAIRGTSGANLNKITGVTITNGGTGGTTVAAAQTNLQVDPAGTAVAMAIALG